MVTRNPCCPERKPTIVAPTAIASVPSPTNRTNESVSRAYGQCFRHPRLMDIRGARSGSCYASVKILCDPDGRAKRDRQSWAVPVTPLDRNQRYARRNRRHGRFAAHAVGTTSVARSRNGVIGAPSKADVPSAVTPTTRPIFLIPTGISRTGWLNSVSGEDFREPSS